MNRDEYGHRVTTTGSTPSSVTSASLTSRRMRSSFDFRKSSKSSMKSLFLSPDAAELALKLGIRASPRTVSAYGPREPRRIELAHSIA